MRPAVDPWERLRPMAGEPVFRPQSPLRDQIAAEVERAASQQIAGDIGVSLDELAAIYFKAAGARGLSYDESRRAVAEGMRRAIDGGAP